MVIALRAKPFIISAATLAALLLLYLGLQAADTPYVPKVSSLPKIHHNNSPPSEPARPVVFEQPLNGTAWEFDSERDERNLGLTDEQCEIAFPEQYAEITRAREYHESQGGIQEKQIKFWRKETDKAHGQLKLLIYNGDLHIVGEKAGVVDRNRYMHGAAMIYRAITAIPDPRVLPNVEFTIDRMDHPQPPPGGGAGRPGRTVWAWTRHIDDKQTWVMPDFNGWASSDWDRVGGYRALREKSKKYLTPFSEKTPKLLWRGQLDVGMTISPIRTALVDVTKDKPWSDVDDIRWGGKAGAIDMEKHCQWQFLAHTEGNSWSGRLRNLVNCNSAIIIHNPLQWVAHFYSILKSEGPEQNYIAVKNDWSDLEEKMNYFLEHTDEAERIAEQGRRTFRDRYMTPAAEACYIRRMIYEWAKVQKWEPELYKGEKMRGVSWERFSWRGAPHLEGKPNPPDDYFWKSEEVAFED